MGYIDIDGIIILKWLVMKGHEDVDCIRLVRGRAVVHTIMSLAIP
jgi:hypothetical protein